MHDSSVWTIYRAVTFQRTLKPFNVLTNQCFPKGLKLSGFWQKNVVSFLGRPDKPCRACGDTLTFNIPQLITAVGFNFGAFICLYLARAQVFAGDAAFMAGKNSQDKDFGFPVPCFLAPSREVWVNMMCLCHTSSSFSLITSDNVYVVWNYTW